MECDEFQHAGYDLAEEVARQCDQIMSFLHERKNEFRKEEDTDWSFIRRFYRVNVDAHNPAENHSQQWKMEPKERLYHIAVGLAGWMKLVLDPESAYNKLEGTSNTIWVVYVGYTDARVQELLKQHETKYGLPAEIADRVKIVQIALPDLRNSEDEGDVNLMKEVREIVDNLWAEREAATENKR
jgi:hypothetical protein